MKKKDGVPDGNIKFNVVWCLVFGVWCLTKRLGVFYNNYLDEII